MAYCEGCGRPLEPDARFCTTCGRQVPEENGPQVRRCEACGAELLPGAKFCDKCGAKVGAMAAPPVSATVPVMPRMTVAPAVAAPADAGLPAGNANEPPYPLEGTLPPVEQADAAIRANEETIRQMVRELVGNFDAPANAGESILSSWLGE